MDICRKCNIPVEEVLVVKTGYACKKCVSAYNRAYREANKKHIAASKAAWKARNIEHVKAKDKEYALRNPEKKEAARKKWKANNPGLDLQAKQKYIQANKGKVKEIKARNLAKRKLRTPAWLTDFDKLKMQCIYSVAAMLTRENNEPWHVDHIIPLQGKIISGLHVPNNLQVLRRSDNLSKNNKYEVAYA